MTSHQKLLNEPPQSPKTWLVTGMAGAVGGNVLEALLKLYAVTKKLNELYADVFDRSYGFATNGMPCVNFFGSRQAPRGPDAAVIPKCTAALLKGETAYIHGDGETSRDLCVANSAQANLLASTSVSVNAKNHIFNVAVGEPTTLYTLFALLRGILARHGYTTTIQPIYQDFLHHRLAYVGKAERLLRCFPKHWPAEGIAVAMPWYVVSKNREVGL